MDIICHGETKSFKNLYGMNAAFIMVYSEIQKCYQARIACLNMHILWICTQVKKNEFTSKIIDIPDIV